MSEASPSTEETAAQQREAAGEETREAAREESREAAGEEVREAAGEEVREAAGEEAREADGEPRHETAHESARESGGTSSGTRETIVELGERARAVVEELARHARERREAAEQAARKAARQPREPFLQEPVSRGSAQDSATLPQQLGALRACVVEVSDVLEATIERLETVENQLGDPDTSIEKDLAEGIARCERVLMGIEHRVEGGAALPIPAHIHSPVFVSPAAASVVRVLVVARSSRRRAELCIAVERQGLCAVAAHDLGMALRAASRSMPEVALLDLEGTQAERVRALEEWTDYLDSGALPRAAVIGAGDTAAGSGIEVIDEKHGEAAMAAVLVQLARGSASETEIDNGDPARSGPADLPLPE